MQQMIDGNLGVIPSQQLESQASELECSQVIVVEGEGEFDCVPFFLQENFKFS